MADKVLTVIETILKDVDKLFIDIQPALPEACAIASMVFPPLAAELDSAVAIAGLVQNFIVLVEQKHAAIKKPLTPEQQVAEVLLLAGKAISSLLADPKLGQLLKQEGITGDMNYVQNLITIVLGLLKTMPSKA